MVIRVPTSINIPDNYFLKPADVIVERVGDRARAVDRYGNLITESTDHASVWQSAIDNAPYYGIVVGLGEFIFKGQVIIKKPLTITGGRFIRDPTIGTKSHVFFIVGNGKGEPILDGTIRFSGCYIDGNERNISQTYGELANAPVHDGIEVLKVRSFIVNGCTFKDIGRSAIWVTCVECIEGEISHNEVRVLNNYFENIAYGITAEAYEKLIVGNNVVRGINSDGDPTTYDGFFVNPNYLEAHDTVITGNIVDGLVPEGYPYAGTYGRNAYNVGGDVNIENVIITSNIFRNLHVAVRISNKHIVAYNSFRDVWRAIEVPKGDYNIIAFNKIHRFYYDAIGVGGTSSDYAENNIIMYNDIDAEDQTPEYGLNVWNYARRNIVVLNRVKGSYSTDPYYVWPTGNITDSKQYDTTTLSNLANDLPNYEFTSILPFMIYYDGTNYYLVIVDLINKTIRKAQLS